MSVTNLCLHAIKWFQILLFNTSIIQSFADCQIDPSIACAVGWRCCIYKLHLCRGVRPTHNASHGYDTKQSDGEFPVMLELWGMRKISSLPSLLGPLWPGVVVPDRVLCMNQIELNCMLMLN